MKTRLFYVVILIIVEVTLTVLSLTLNTIRPSADVESWLCQILMGDSDLGRRK